MTKIAIVEDDQIISQMYRIKFESEDFEVETADNGNLGLELIKSMSPDIVLLDLMMPEMNGDEVLKKLRAEPWGKNVKVLILTNVGEQEIPGEIWSLGVSAVILKANMTPSQVVTQVKKVLAN